MRLSFGSVLASGAKLGVIAALALVVAGLITAILAHLAGSKQSREVSKLAERS